MKINTRNSAGLVATPNDRENYNRYLCEVNKFTPLTKEEEVNLFKKIEKGDKKALDIIYKHNLLFVLTVARQYNKMISNSTLCLEDLVSEGNLGLYTAIKKFDYRAGNKFISYAVWWIKQSISSCINENNKNIRVSYNSKTKFNKYMKIQSNLEQDLGRVPTINEVFDTMVKDGDIKSRTDVSDIAEMLRINGQEASLNMFVSDEETTELIDLIKSDDTNGDPCSILMNDEKMKITYNMLSELPNNGREILSDYFGLFDRETLTISEMAKKYKMSGQSIRNNIVKFLKVLRTKNANKSKYFINRKYTKSKIKIRDIKKL